MLSPEVLPVHETALKSNLINLLSHEYIFRSHVGVMAVSCPACLMTVSGGPFAWVRPRRLPHTHWPGENKSVSAPLPESECVLGGRTVMIVSGVS